MGVIGNRATTTTLLDILEQRGTLPETSANNTVLETQLDSAAITALTTAMTGTPIIVSYYHRITTDIDNSTSFRAVSFLSDSINTSFLHIKQMEIKLESGMEYEYDTETATSTLSGSAFMYPGLTPKQGDMFLYSITKKDIGLFKISNNPQRMALQSSTAHKVTFSLVKVLTMDDLNALKERTRQVAVFDKTRFLATEGGLLTEQEVVDIDTLKNAKIALLRAYHRDFYSTSRSSFFDSQDGIYDPYVVQFYIQVFGCYSLRDYVTRINGDDLLMDYGETIFGRLMNIDIGVELSTKAEIKVHRFERGNSLTSVLHNTPYLQLLPPDSDIEPNVPYAPNVTLDLTSPIRTEFDDLVTGYIVDGEVSVVSLLDLAKTISRDCSALNLYKMPILAFIMDKVVDSLYGGSSIELIPATRTAQLKVEFTSEDLNDIGKLEINVMECTIVALINNLGVVVDLDTVVVVDGIATIDIQPILFSLGLDTLEGTWQVITLATGV